MTCRYYQHNPVTGECQNCDEPEINHQIGGNHYSKMTIEPIDAMKSWADSPNEKSFNAHCRLTAIKYLARAGHKDGYKTDIQKAKHYLSYILENLK